MWKNEKNSSEKTKVLKSVLVSQDFFVNQKIYRNVETCVLKLPMFWKKTADVF